MFFWAGIENTVPSCTDKGFFYYEKTIRDNDVYGGSSEQEIEITILDETSHLKLIFIFC